jgi:hypothetical protein
LLLTNHWNLDPKYEPAERGVILHYPQKARRWEGIIYGAADSDEAWKKVAEWEKTHRVEVGKR